MKKIFALLLAVLLLSVTVSAQAPFVVDGSGLLTQAEAESLENTFSQNYTQNGFAVAIATVDSLDEKTAAEYAAEYYAGKNYGNDGILLLICENEGQWYIYTSGICASVISNEETVQIGTAILNDLQAGDYNSACETFAEMSMKPVSEEVAAKAAAAEDVQNSQKKYVVLGLVGGLLVGILVAVLLAMKAKTPKKSRTPAPVVENQNSEG